MPSGGDLVNTGRCDAAGFAFLPPGYQICTDGDCELHTWPAYVDQHAHYIGDKEMGDNEVSEDFWPAVEAIVDAAQQADRAARSYDGGGYQVLVYLEREDINILARELAPKERKNG